MGNSISDHVEEEKKIAKKRKAVPKKIRYMVWRQYVGDSLNGKCYCCDGDIIIENWHVGHVISVARGGGNIVENLRPLCASCNLSMGERHMGDFIREYNLKGMGSKEFKIKTWFERSVYG